METTFKKTKTGVVINTNNKGLRESQARKKAALKKIEREDNLEKRINEINSKLDKLINLVEEIHGNNSNRRH